MNKQNINNKLKQVNQKLDKVVKLEKQNLTNKQGKKKGKKLNNQKLFNKYNNDHGYGMKILTNPNKFRYQSLTKTERMLEDYSRYTRLQYIMGALHPKLAYENKWDVRYPSILPVPTACVRVMATHNLTSGTSGQMYINYVPGTLIASNASQIEASGLTVNVTCNGSGTAGTNYFVSQPFFSVPQMWDRYRLVGAEIIGTYTGNVFNRQGSVFAGVHYEPATIAVKGAVGSGSIPSIANSNVDRFSSNLGLVKNQLWAETRNISEGQTQISYVWTPDSPSNLLYAGYIPSTSTVGVVLNSTVGNAVNTADNAQTKVNYGSSSNTHGPDRQINYFYQGLPPSSQCIRIDIYELYEYIPDVASLNVVTVNSTRLSIEDVKMVSEVHPLTTETSNIKNLSEVLVNPELYKKENTMLSKMGKIVSSVAPTLIEKVMGYAMSTI